MDHYEILEEIDEGAFGIVVKARNKKTHETVAIKRIKQKYKKWEECINLREVKSLPKLIHPNIIKLKEVFKKDNELFLVFEYCEFNLFKYYNVVYKEQNRQMAEQEIKKIIY